MKSKPLGNKKDNQQYFLIRIAGLVLLIPVLLSIFVIKFLAPLIERFLSASKQTVGGMGNVWAAIAMSPLVLIWGVSVFTVRPVISVGLLMLSFPFLSRTRDFIFVPAYRFTLISDLWVERIGVTSVFVVALFIVFLLRKIPMRRPENKYFRLTESSLWLFAILGTVSQLFNHNLLSAILLSFSGLWQYLFWFYIIMGAIQSLADLKILLVSYCLMLIVNIVLRQLFTGVSYDLSWAERGLYATRFYASGLGWAYNYSILLVIGIVITLGLLSSAMNNLQRGILVLISFIQAFELAFTFTRGAVIILFLSILVLLTFQTTRKQTLIWVSIVFSFLILVFILNRNEVFLVLGARALFVKADLTRFELLAKALPDALHNFGFGYGIGKVPLYTTQWSSGQFSVHNLLLILTHGVGLWATLSWLIAFSSVTIGLVKEIYFFRCNKAEFIIIVIAIFGWFLFANNGLDITSYYPFEANQIIYMLMASSFLFIQTNVDFLGNGATTKSV